MRNTKRVPDPNALLAMRDERADADDRVIDMFRELDADRFPDFIIRGSAHAVCRRVAAQIRHGLEVPDDDAVVHSRSFAQRQAQEKPATTTKQCKGFGNSPKNPLQSNARVLTVWEC